MNINDLIQEAKNTDFVFPFSEKEYIVSEAAKNAGAHSHTFGVLLAKYREQVKQANAYAYALSAWEKCVKDFGSLDFPAWHNLYDIE